MVVDHDLQIMAPLVHGQMQSDSRGDIPIALDNPAGRIDPDDVAGRQFIPRQFPRIDEEGSIRLGKRNVSGDMIIISFTVKRSGQQREFLRRGQFGKQRPAPWHRGQFRKRRYAAAQSIHLETPGFGSMSIGPRPRPCRPTAPH